jgi:hypothetical protein
VALAAACTPSTAPAEVLAERARTSAASDIARAVALCSSTAPAIVVCCASMSAMRVTMSAMAAAAWALPAWMFSIVPAISRVARSVRSASTAGSR